MSTTNKPWIRCIASAMLSLSIVLAGATNNAADADPLNPKQQSIVIIAAFTANGNLPKLDIAIQEGLDAGLTVSEIKEVIVQMYAYAGFPRSLNALHTFMEVLKERKSRGINDAQGKTASPYPPNKSKLEFGTENQTRLVGSPVKGEVYTFAPAIDQFLKEHLFGDIFGRDILDYQTREIATIAALATLGGTDNQLRSHLKVGMHNGLTKDQLDNIVSVIRSKVGEIEGTNAARVLRAALGLDEGTGKENDIKRNFTGAVSVNMMVSPDSLFNTQMGAVTFEPGARTNWHYHPSGQILIVTDGTAYYQEKGKPRQVLSKGQVVKCPPNVHHWHGATQQGSMTHIALSTNLQMGSVVWLEKVTDEEYESKK
jgi:4-carboxymuconolactone decarboxylase